MTAIFAGNKNFALFNLGLRPFYLLGALFAGTIIPCWALFLQGHIDGITGGIPMDIWHAHELLFGFVTAIITGFLFTAVTNWTKQPMPKGWLLALFCMLWILARVQFSLQLHPWLVIADLIFLPCVTAAVAIAVLRANNYRNLVVVAVLAILSILNAVFYMYAAGDQYHLMRTMLVGAVNGITILMVVIGGRVVPNFTRNAIPSSSPKSFPLLEHLVLFSMVLLFASELFLQSDWNVFHGSIAFLAFILNILRFAFWSSFRTLNTPMLWILHLGYVWIIISLGLKAGHYFGLPIPYSLAIHAVTIGAVGALALGMMTRSSKGHTGRLLIAHGWDILIFVLISLAAVTRVLGGLFLENMLNETIMLSAIFWSLAFIGFFCSYLVPLVMPRIDGKPG